MNLEKIVKFLEDTIGLPATIISCNWIDYHKYNKLCQFITSTGLEAFHVNLISQDGYDWKLSFDISHDWNLFFLIFGEEDNRKNTDLSCRCGCYKDFYGRPVDLFGKPV